jgi:dimethylsulfoniopropionate demethylase
MQDPAIALSPRLRPSAYASAVEAAGVRYYDVYNHMRLPVCYESFEADCAHLKSHVQLWDVGAQRQVELRGPDADRLAQLMTPRDLSALRAGQAAYAPLVDRDGRLVNDPVLLPAGEDCWWLSIADSDVRLWADGLATGLGLDVMVSEADVHPLAVQGPKAGALLARLAGDALEGMRLFDTRRVDFGLGTYLVSRSGWSKQGGYEIYVEGAENAVPLWDALMGLGSDLKVRAGSPNIIERVESGLLSYGCDIGREHTPYEAGLGRYLSPETVDCLGREALLEEKARGPARQIRSLEIEGPPVPRLSRLWPLRGAEGEAAGRVSAAVHSTEFDANIAIAMIERAHFAPGTVLEVETPEGPRKRRVREKFCR